MLWICLGCTAAYSVGAPCCPQCGKDEHVDEGTAVLVGEDGPEVLLPPEDDPQQ